ncbi:MAG: dihydrodipicolinate synthase family protein, partial [Bauldia sp.]|nr:dihydrodipicolinate synthase family protein [Bauldia sp.]
CAAEDAAILSRHAADLGTAGVLLLPPFYYKKVSDEGLYAFVARLIEKIGQKVPRILLYHIPAVAGVGWSADLVERLRQAFPAIVVGMKDSSGDFEHTRRMIERFPGFAVFPGAEVYVLKAMAAGAVGCISASANINARGIRRLLDSLRLSNAEALQNELNDVRKAVESRVLIPAVKAVLAARYRDPAWLNVRPPLVPLGEAERAALLAEPAIVKLLEPVPA